MVTTFFCVCLVLTLLFLFKLEGSVDSDRGSVIDSEEKDEEVSGKYQLLCTSIPCM